MAKFKAGDKAILTFISGWGGRTKTRETTIVSVDEKKNLVVTEGVRLNKFDMKGKLKELIMDLEVTLSPKP